MNQIKNLKKTFMSDSEIKDCLDQHAFFQRKKTYYAMYSSLWNGFTNNISLMSLPVDDHMVHRGDGIFEAIKVIYHKAYLLDSHLERLFISADKISLKVPYSYEDLKMILNQTIEIAGEPEGILRLFLSRGPGSFTTNPYECLGPQLYVIFTELKRIPEEKHLRGVTIGKSLVPPKPSLLATTKSCNYLPNVLQKKESVDRGLDFTIGVDEQGGLTEGSTENIVILNQEGILIHPVLDRVLKGTTMSRLFDLVEEQKLLPTARGRSFKEEDLLKAQEVFMVGTTLDVLKVREYEGKPLGQGPWAEKLRKLIQEDQRK